MLTLPSSMFQSVQHQQAPQHEPINYIEPVAPSRHAKIPLITILVVVTLVLMVGFYWLVH